MRKATFIIPAAVIVVALILSSVFIVDERQRALVLRFGEIRNEITEPGLNFRIPIFETVVFYDDRILSLDTAPIEVTPSDDRRLVVDAFARYRIIDTRQFRLAVGAGGLREAERLLEDILNPQIRAVLGSDGVTSNSILSEERAALMDRITAQARALSIPLGLDILDVRLKQTALPQQNLEATFARMRAEREREATDERARGAEAAQRVRAQADRTVVELVSEANREAEIIRGEADATRNNIFAEAFGQDPDFFEFYRSMTAYERALTGENSSIVLSPSGHFFDFFGSPTGRDPTAIPATDPASHAVPAPAPAAEAAPAAPAEE